MQAFRLCTSPLRGLNTSVNFARSSQRLFSISAQRFNEEETPKTPEVHASDIIKEVGGAESLEEELVENVEIVEDTGPENPSSRRREFFNWMKTQGHKYSRPSKGTTNYIGETPFPNNPLFQPKPPLSEVTKQYIYDAFMKDSKMWTVRKLATKYAISIKRVEAILKLKSAEKQMEANGFILQKKFAKGMEQLMGVDRSTQLLKEPLADVFPNVGKPKFKTLKEDATFTPKDAAKILHLMPYKDLEKHVIERESVGFTLDNVNTGEQTSKPKKKFVIVNTSA